MAPSRKHEVIDLTADEDEDRSFSEVPRPTLRAFVDPLGVDALIDEEDRWPRFGVNGRMPAAPDAAQPARVRDNDFLWNEAWDVLAAPLPVASPFNYHEHDDVRPAASGSEGRRPSSSRMQQRPRHTTVSGASDELTSSLLPAKVCLSRVVAMFPDVDHDHVEKLWSDLGLAAGEYTVQMDNSILEQRITQVVENLISNPQYPRKSRKRKHEEQTEDEGMVDEWLTFATSHDQQEITDSFTTVECQACFDDVYISHATPCDNADIAHYTCHSCMITYIKTIVGEARCRVLCTAGCGAEFAAVQLHRLSDKALLAKLERLQQDNDIREAGIEDLEECPFCDYKAIMTANVNEDCEFRCQNPECEVVSCRRCHIVSHVPQTCAEHAAKHRAAARQRVEEAMTDALVRKCNRCAKRFVKEAGCNKMSCPSCHNQQCYVCSKDVKDYSHFDENRPGAYVRPGGAGGGDARPVIAQIAGQPRDDGDYDDDYDDDGVAPTEGKEKVIKKCPLYDDVEARHAREVEEAGAAARAAVLAEDPEIDANDIAVAPPPVATKAVPKNDLHGGMYPATGHAALLRYQMLHAEQAQQGALMAQRMPVRPANVLPDLHMPGLLPMGALPNPRATPVVPQPGHRDFTTPFPDYWHFGVRDADADGDLFRQHHLAQQQNVNLQRALRMEGRPVDLLAQAIQRDRGIRREHAKMVPRATGLPQHGTPNALVPNAGLPRPPRSMRDTERDIRHGHEVARDKRAEMERLNRPLASVNRSTLEQQPQNGLPQKRPDIQLPQCTSAQVEHGSLLVREAYLERARAPSVNLADVRAKADLQRDARSKEPPHSWFNPELQSPRWGLIDLEAQHSHAMNVSHRPNAVTNAVPLRKNIAATLARDLGIESSRNAIVRPDVPPPNQAEGPATGGPSCPGTRSSHVVPTSNCRHRRDIQHTDRANGLGPAWPARRHGFAHHAPSPSTETKPPWRSETIMRHKSDYEARHGPGAVPTMPFMIDPTRISNQQNPFSDFDNFVFGGGPALAGRSQEDGHQFLSPQRTRPTDPHPGPIGMLDDHLLQYSDTVFPSSPVFANGIRDIDR